MAGSPLVQHYKMEVSWRSRDQTSLPESHVTDNYLFFPYYHKKSLMSWPPLEVQSLLRLQPLGTTDEMHRFCSSGSHITVEIFWVFVPGCTDKYREGMTVLVCSCFRTTCAILTSLLCLPQTMRAEFSAPSWLLIWALAGCPVHRGNVVWKAQNQKPASSVGADPLLETKSISQISSMLVKL